MEAAFKTILVISLYSSIVGIVIIVLKKLLKNKISPKWHYIIWFILLLKMLIPFGPESVISLFNFVPKVQQNVSFSQTYKQYHETITFKHQEKSNISTIHIAKDKSLYFVATLESIMPYIWILGIFLMTLWIACSNYLLHKSFKKYGNVASEAMNKILETCKRKTNTTKNIKIVIIDKINTPAILGMFKPKILLSPENLNLNDNQITYILLHELSHYKRKDLIVNYILLILQIIHWFNPVIWYCFKMIRQDMEVATDEMVLFMLGDEEKKEYGRAILAVLENFNTSKFVPKLIGMVDDKKNMERRIRMIKMNNFFKSKRKIILLIGTLAIVMLGGGLLTNAVTNKTSLVIGNYTDKVLKFKTAYVGNNSKVVNLIDNLPYAKFRKQISLKTDKVPYGITVQYDFNQTKIDMEKVSATLKNNTVLMFALIDNVDVINFNLNTGSKELNYKYTRSEIQKSFPKDLNSYSKDIKEFGTLLKSFALTLFAYPDRYSPTMSSIPGIEISVKYNGTADKVKYSTKHGEFLTWNSRTGTINNLGQNVKLSLDTPVYWTPLYDGVATKNKKIAVCASILSKNSIMTEKQINIISEEPLWFKIER